MPVSIFIALFFFTLLRFSSAQDASSCTPGTFFDFRKCRKCPAGTYQPFRGSTSCIPCPRGTFNIFKGAQGVDLCEPCKPNTFNPSTGATSPSMCKKCPPGTASISGSARCITCPPGRFVALPGRVTENYRRGYNFNCSPRRQTGLPPPSCYPGDLPRRSICAKCIGDSFTNVTNALRCERCPSDLRANADNTGCGGCSRPGVFCRQGLAIGTVQESPCTSFTINDGSKRLCEPCPGSMIGNSEIGGTECVPCPPGTYKPFARSPCLQCSKTVVANGTRCEEVNPGAPCPPNFFRNAEGFCAQCSRTERLNTKKMICQDCGSDRESSGGIDRTCSRCPANSFSDASARIFSGCSFCRCRPGSIPLQSCPVRCMKCPPGTTSRSTSRGFLCVACESGTIAPNEGSSECVPCPFNLVPNSERSKCVRCPRGMVPNPVRGCVSAMTNCPAGQKRIVDRNGIIIGCTM